MAFRLISLVQGCYIFLSQFNLLLYTPPLKKVDRQDQEVYQTVAYNGTVTIADPPQSIFDPQAWFLYIILASVLGAAAYFVYSTYLPQSPCSVLTC